MLNWLKKPVFLIFFIAVLFRFFYNYLFLGLNSPPNEHDFWLEKVAVNLSSGNGYGLTKGEPTARKLPLFSMFLAGIYYIFGHNFIIARLFQILLGALSVLGVYLIVEILYGKKEALISGILLACDPLYIYLSGWFLTENLFIPLIVFFIYFSIKYQEQKKNIFFLILAGSLLGLSSLTRASLSIFPFFIFLWCLINNYPDKKQYLKETLIIVSIMYIFIFGWALRNYMVFNDIILTETGSGKMFWGANNPDAIGDVVLMTGSPRLYKEDEKKGKNWRDWQGSPWLNVFLSTINGKSEKEVDDRYFKKGFEWIKNNFKDFLFLLPKKIYYFWNFWSPHASFPDIPQNLFLIAKGYYYILLLSALIGIYFTFKSWKKNILFYFLLSNFTISTLLFFGDARQRIPIVPILAIFAGLGISGIIVKKGDKNEPQRTQSFFMF